MCEHHMSQAVVLSIVLTLAVGQNLTLLCRTWCDAHEAAAASECHHKNSSPAPSVAGDDNCDNLAALATAVLRDVRRDVSPQDANETIPVPRYLLGQLTVDTRLGQEAGREWSLEERPLSTALRI
jgi:hypothetical protein